MKRILILAGRYLPGFKDGGPVRTLVNLTESFGDKYAFSIACADRDHGDTESYPDITPGRANRVGKADVYYIREGRFDKKTIKELSDKADILYVCGPYNGYAYLSMQMKKRGLISPPLVIAPMGSFSKGALGIKKGKKLAYLKLIRLLGYFKNVIWSASSEAEKSEIKSIAGNDARVFVAEDLPSRPIVIKRTGIKAKNSLRVVFLSRISRKKNLSYALRILNRDWDGDISFDIYGVIEDKEYFSECMRLKDELKGRVSCRYMGEAAPDRVGEIFSGYDIFLFPTLGENFGHVVFEAMAAGCVPLISDTTIWRDLNERSAGFVVPLKDEDGFTEKLRLCMKMGADEFTKLSDFAMRYAGERYEESLRNSGYREIFDRL